MRGPYLREESTTWPNTTARKTYRKASWYRTMYGQKVRTPLPYNMSNCVALTPGTDAPNHGAGYYCQDQPPLVMRDEYDLAYNKCYEKYVAATQSASAQVGANLGERRQSIDMMTKRFKQLTKAARHLKQGRFYDFLSDLGLFPGRNQKEFVSPKRASDLWLEYWFGWSPLVSDLYSCIDILQSPVPQLIKVRVYTNRGVQPMVTTDARFMTWSHRELCGARFRTHMGARVRVSNPNLWRANQLGLINPAAIAWELIPFSFVVDWFSTVGQVINSWTDLFGLDIVDPYVTRTSLYHSAYSAWDNISGEEFLSHIVKGARCSRSLGIPGPTLQIRPWKGLSMTRAATAISLLIQQLDSLKH